MKKISFIIFIVLLSGSLFGQRIYFGSPLKIRLMGKISVESKSITGKQSVLTGVHLDEMIFNKFIVGVYGKAKLNPITSEVPKIYGKKIGYFEGGFTGGIYFGDEYKKKPAVDIYGIIHVGVACINWGDGIRNPKDYTPYIEPNFIVEKRFILFKSGRTVPVLSIGAGVNYGFGFMIDQVYTNKAVRGPGVFIHLKYLLI